MKENNEESNQIYNPYTGKTENKNDKKKYQQKEIFENGNNLNNLYNTNNNEKDNNYIDLSLSQIITTKKDNMTINNEKIKNDLRTISSKKTHVHHHHKKKLTVNFTEEEEIYFYNLFESLDTNNLNKLDSVLASTFFKKSGLPKHVLKEIWLMVVKYSTSHITREEFYIILRLISLAQNNLPYTEESINNNTAPIALPLPTFKYKIKMNNRIIYKLTENNKIAYKRLFDNNKANKDDVDIVARKAITIWQSANVSDDSIRKISSIITPLEKKGHFNLKEFQVANYLFAISDKYEIPDKLPLSLFNYLGRGEKSENDLSNKNEMNKIDKKILDKNNLEECNEYIRNALQKAKELNKENNIINEKIMESKNKIKNLIENIQNLEKEQDTIKEKLNFIYNGCSDLIDFLEKNKNNMTQDNKSKENININNINNNHNNHNNSIDFKDNMIDDDNKEKNQIKNENIVDDNKKNNFFLNNEKKENKEINKEQNIPIFESNQFNNKEENAKDKNNGQINDINNDKFYAS